MAEAIPMYAAVGFALYVSKFIIFLLLPRWIVRFFHYNRLTMVIWDAAMGYTIAHAVALAGGQMSLVVTVVFGFCSAIYILLYTIFRSVKRTVRCYI